MADEVGMACISGNGVGHENVIIFEGYISEMANRISLKLTNF